MLVSRLAAARWRWPVLVVGAALFGVAALAFLDHERAPRTTAVQRGRALVEQLGCFGCHGPEGTGGVPNPGALEGEVPPLRMAATLPSYVQSERELFEWVRDGQPARRAAAVDAATAGAQPALRMPAYRDHLTSAQLDDVVAWLRAAGGHQLPRDPELVRARELARRLGCFGCHGEDGRGGLANPGSWKGVIPPWDSADYLELVRDDGELREWILDGEIARFRDNPAAAFFLRRQAVKMPSYRGRVSEAELLQLTRYLGWVRAPRDVAGWQERWVIARGPGAPSALAGGEVGAEAAVRRGAALYVSTGCAACHGAAGAGGLQNGSDVVPSLDDLADKLELFEPEDVATFLAAVGRGQPLADPATALPIPEWSRVQAQVRRVRDLIRYGAMVGGADEATAPPMPMPAWAFRVHPGASRAAGPPDLEDLDALDDLIAYLVSLSRTQGANHE
jgi:mono/diheme cytochrome c family protein